MKILHINLERGFRGGERQTLYLMEGLRDLGHENVLMARDNESFVRRVLDKNFPVKVIRKPFFLWGPYLKKFDIIQAHEVRGLQLAAFWKSFHCRPLIYTRRVLFVPSRNPMTVYKYKKIDYLVANSFSSMNVMQKWGIDPSLMGVVHSVIRMDSNADSSRVAALKRRFSGHKVIGCVASLESEKDHLTLIKAASLIKKEYSKVVFLIIGDGSLRSMLEQSARDMRLDNVIFEGFQDDPYPYYDVFDVFVLTSSEESFSNAILDAFLYRVPVVATNAQGNAELITDGQTGSLVPVGEPVSLASNILKMLEDEDLRDRCSTNAYHYLEGNFTVPIMAKAYEKIYINTVKSFRG
jgi:L-malate glycosyltransferase